MSTGYAHVIKLGTVEDSGGLRIPQYQFTYNDGTNSYGRTFDEAALVEFLRSDLGLRADILDNVLTDLRTRENSLINDLHIAENETSVMGLQHVSSDV